MLYLRGFDNPWPKAVKRYGSPLMYMFLLFLGCLPTLILFFGSFLSLVQLIRRRTWYLWGVVVAGPLIAWGLFYLQSTQVEMDAWARDRVKYPDISFIDIGASLLAQALFATLIRLAWSVLPTAASTSLSIANEERRKVLRDRRVGYYLLVPHVLIAVVATYWAPRASSFTPFLQLPFCAYLAFVAREYRRLAREEWGVCEEEEEDRRRRPSGRLFDALVVAAGGLTVRSILGIIAVVIGIYTREAFYAVALVWAIICDDIVIFLCFRVFWAAHPGWYLPPQLRGLVFNKKARKSFASIELE